MLSTTIFNYQVLTTLTPAVLELVFVKVVIERVGDQVTMLASTAEHISVTLQPVCVNTSFGLSVICTRSST